MRFQTGSRDMSSLHSARNGAEGQAPFYSVSWLCSVPAVRLLIEADHSAPSRAEVKNGWNYN